MGNTGFACRPEYSAETFFKRPISFGSERLTWTFGPKLPCAKKITEKDFSPFKRTLRRGIKPGATPVSDPRLGRTPPLQLPGKRVCGSSVLAGSQSLGEHRSAAAEVINADLIEHWMRSIRNGEFSQAVRRDGGE